ncbi:solute carrier family 35 member E2-like [Lingula anatina]|uniref:Solute carrier family 35 member E2-like n=1 Tax=Lingula anatina TaxID=7574 RepID=A0A1S3HFF6_LINAN|nr:solute carrier family 35 member E2-like [Lingula anatina]XP_013384813.1 solute carrier family 35 member E2-like [Lingula anatina]|eukprot:XP_013384812.1 solute carrier family 35 member E2-like [Lingula anatina]
MTVEESRKRTASSSEFYPEGGEEETLELYRERNGGGGNHHHHVTHMSDMPSDLEKGGRLNKAHVVLEEKEGLFNPRAMLFLILWYLFSAGTLFLNKHILTTLKGDPTLLSTMQMFCTTCLGFLQMFLPLGMYKPVKREGKPPNFLRNMVLVGSMRFSTVLLGLVALKYVAVSFTETVKSSAPIFTVLISRLLIGETTGVYVLMSLVPIMGGLALCSAYELSFNIEGFTAALATNITECLQNVYSKMLVSGEKYRYTPAELQFYTSAASMVVQIPVGLLMIDFEHVWPNLTASMVTALILNGVFFHFQSISAYVLMGYISPVTHSVANTVKRAFLIWASVLIFGNAVTFLSGLGTVTVTIGVILYNKAREYDQIRHEMAVTYGDKEMTQA